VVFFISRNCPGLLTKLSLRFEALLKTLAEMKMPGARPGISSLAIRVAGDR
jgi:hypothetical protein